ncbi:MAG: hypothetical protein HYS33_03055 [Acidobacteria bacterium]|nr:hypothetical protein [Acidobacteriota bacterium]MBI1983522.1 hypothetical protein [Acidobacteriota bacterium]
MRDGHIAAGILLLAITFILLSAKYFRTPKRAQFPWWGWVGLAEIFLVELLLFQRTLWVTTFFTPLVWTGYLLFADGLVWSLRGESRLGTSPSRFLALAFWSVPLWLVFEAYNLRLANWTYVGLPGSLLVQGIGYVWSFATIWPAIYETADLLKALELFRESRTRLGTFGRSSRRSMFVAGLLCVSIPVLVPVQVGQYLFGAVWAGFVLLLDPLSYHWRGRSLFADIESGQTATLYSLLGSGLICGLLWEFWNYWAEAKWLYIFPIWPESKIFEMPLPGYLGFPVFALECFVMYEFLQTLKNQILRSSRGQKLEGVSLGL